MHASPVSPGDIVAGKYRVGEVLGHGGMGVVVRAMDVDLERPVAIKFLLTTQLDTENAYHRFRREARATAQIESNHAVRVYDSGRTKKGEPFIVMEWLKGVDLATRLRKDAPLAVSVCVELVLQACEGLAEAHSRGIIHRDIKPGNLFLEDRADGTQNLKLLDFGLAKPVASGSMTASNRLMGSPIYMSPEQISSPRDVDERSDIWSLGVVLYEALTGLRPFRGETVLAVCADVINREPEPPSATGVELPPGLDDLVLRCICRERGLRFADVAELAQALEPFASARFQGSAGRVRTILEAEREVPDVSESPDAESGSLSAERGWSTTGPESGRGRRPLAVAGLLVIAAVLVLIAYQFRQEPSEALGSSAEESAAAATSPSSGGSQGQRADAPGAVGAAAVGSAAAGSAAVDPPLEGELPVSAPSAEAPLPGAANPAPSRTTAAPAPALPAVRKPSAPAGVSRPKTPPVRRLHQDVYDSRH